MKLKVWRLRYKQKLGGVAYPMFSVAAATPEAALRLGLAELTEEQTFDELESTTDEIVVEDERA